MLSIVIITRNRCNDLYIAIRSCIDKVDEHYEVIIVDNNSTDNTKLVVKRVCEENDFILNYIECNENLGVAAARNIGFSQAKGDIVYFLDDDAYIDNTQIPVSDICNFMRKNSDIAIVATEIFNTKENIWQHSIFPKGVPTRTEGEVFDFIGASHFIKKEVFLGKELYPKDFFYGSEELYASLVVLSMGLKIWYNNKIIIKHNPSNINRLSNTEIGINNYVNTFIVKLLLLPNRLLFISKIFFILRLIKFCGINIHKWVKCYTFFKKRYKKNSCERMSLEVVINLANKYGWNYLL